MCKHRGIDSLCSNNMIPDAALLEVSNRDLWQLELVSRDQHVCGHIIRQLVQPSMCTIRYVVVYDERSGHHVPVPADMITEITETAVFCNIDAVDFLALPTLTYPMERPHEELIHAILDQTPYWLEEAGMDPVFSDMDTDP
ncbi:MAG: hypothetical protein GX998_01950 [Firmicutes bacterium]|nr:hypothetical protein [Bacillota bacterium]